MFPTKLELDVLYAERVREAEQHRLAREFGAPGLFQRIRARISSFETTAQRAEMEVVPSRQATRRDVPATSQ